MKTCPDCKTEIEEDAVRCQRCGCNLSDDEGTADTLDLWIAGDDSAAGDPHATVTHDSDHIDPHATITNPMPAYVPPPRESTGTLALEDPNATMSDQPATLNESELPSGSNAPGGTVQLDDPNATVTGGSKTLDDPSSLFRSPKTLGQNERTLDGEQDFHMTAFDKVAREHEGHDFSMGDFPNRVDSDSGSASTVDSDSSLPPSDSGSSGSSAGEVPKAATNASVPLSNSQSVRSSIPGATGASGSDGRLKKVWEAAIGTSSRDSSESLRFERAQASDSIFRRVARRKIVDIHASDSAGADYQIQDKLGDGGMGIVFSAIQSAVNRIVAVKSIKSEKQGNESTRKQFFYEAEITADLDHPNIPPIYEMGTTGDDVLFYSMKLIQGTPWQKAISKKTREENLEIFSKIADAVAFAHSRDIIHRDLKPDNVMLGAYGEVYLMDWGLGVNIAKARSVDFGGTPDFMAPEMAANKRREIGKPADVYLLGAILFQIIVGKAPHTGKTAMMRLQAAARNEIIETTIEDPLLDIARKAMATLPSERYPSVESMQEAIREVRRHAESIAMSNRAKELAEKAIENKDYASFTRSLYGFTDAIELWKDNQAAQLGLAHTRLAYGRCAMERGDFDLAVQTLDRRVAEEAAVHEQAVQAKQLVALRGQRLKTLGKVFMISVSSLSVLLAAVALYAWGQKANAERARSTAEIARDGETVAKNKAIEAERTAVAAAEAEAEAKMHALASADAEKKAKDLAQQEEKKAIASAASEKLAKELAIESETKATASAEAARIAKQQAEQRTAQVQIGDAQSKTILAKLQLERFDVQGGAKLVNEIKASSQPEVFGDKAPQWNAWPLQRVSLLGNMDLPRQSMQGLVTAIDYASKANRGVVGTQNGHVHLIEMDKGKVEIRQSLKLDGAIHSLCIAPDGNEAVFGLTKEKKSQMMAWSLKSESQPNTIGVVGNRMFQHIQYSPDGKRLLAGVNSGIWSWECIPSWASQLAPEEIRIIQEAKGQLTQLKWIGTDTVLATTRQGERITLHCIDVRSNRASIIPLPVQLENKLTVVSYTGYANRFLLGTDDGRLIVSDLAMQNEIGSPQLISTTGYLELPTKHRTRIVQIARGQANEIVSVSHSEPVAHVWRIDSQGEISYDTHLAGAPNPNGSSNVETAISVSEREWIGVDESGTAVTWNIERQKQRRLLKRQMASGPETYPAPVVQAFHREDTDDVVSVNEDGVVDLWNLQTGATSSIRGKRWSYFGHTPGAEYVDSAIDLDVGVLVTSASLRNAERSYLSDPNATQEFCVWNISTGEMLTRWAEASIEVIDPRISLLQAGQEILVSSDVETRVVSLDGKDVFRSNEIGTRFAVPNPQNPNLVAMVKLSGYTWLWDRNQPWHVPNEVYYREDRDGTPVKAVWSQDGSRLYQLFSNGKLSVFDLQSDKLVASQAKRDEDKQWRANFGKSYTISRHYDLDLTVSSIDPLTDHLIINVRIPSARPTSRQTMVSISRGSWELTNERTNEVPQHTWLNDSSTHPFVDDRVHRFLSVNPLSRDSVVSRVQSGKQIFASTRRGNVLKLSSDSAQYTSLGRQALLSATSDRKVNTVWTLHKDGAIWKLDLARDGQGTWSRFNIQSQGDTICVSPDGKQLAILDRQRGELKIVDTSGGNTIRNADKVAAVVWHPMQDCKLAIAFRDGRVEVPSENGVDIVANGQHRANAIIKSIQYFKETWSNAATQPNDYLLLQVESEAEGWLQYLPLQADGKAMEQLVRKDAVISVSPTDSVMVIGEASGTLTVWMTSPFWQRAGAVLDLEGHLGSRIKAIVFSHDGKTLITSDSTHRLLGWLSEDRSVVP